MNYKNVKEFCKDVYDTYIKCKDTCGKYDCLAVSVAAHYDVAIDVLNCLLKDFKETNLVFAEIEDYEMDNYEKEYYITIDDNNGIWVQKAWNDHLGKYYSTEDNHVFVHSDCNSKILSSLGEIPTTEFSIEECGCELDNKDEAMITEGKNGIHTVSKVPENNNGYSYISISCSDKSIIEKLADAWSK